MNYRKSEAKEAARAQFRGVWAAITSPFTPKCKVIAHTGHHSAHETVDLTRQAQEAGADFAIVINPYYPPAGEDTIYEWFRFVASRVDIGIWMFDTGYSGYGFSPQLTARIAGIENICGIKLGGRSLEHYAQVQKLAGDRIVLSHPSEAQWLKLMREYGQRVHMSSAAPFILQTADWRPMREYTELGLQGRFGEAEKVSRELEPLRKVHDKWMREPWVKHRVIPIQFLKAWSELLGLAGGPVRAGLPRITEQEREALRADLEQTGMLARVPSVRPARAA